MEQKPTLNTATQTEAAEKQQKPKNKLWKN
jgi:hypothetical protein